jgi:hypothetical protein
MVTDWLFFRFKVGVRRVIRIAFRFELGRDGLRCGILPRLGTGLLEVQAEGRGWWRGGSRTLDSSRGLIVDVDLSGWFFGGLIPALEEYRNVIGIGSRSWSARVDVHGSFEVGDLLSVEANNDSYDLHFLYPSRPRSRKE